MADESPLVRHERHHLAAAGRIGLQPPSTDLIHVDSRRWFLQTGLAGLAGLSLPKLLRCQAQGTAAVGEQRLSLPDGTGNRVVRRDAHRPGADRKGSQRACPHTFFRRTKR
jgi:hypothetical protein